jgi:hypothetical protein
MAVALITLASSLVACEPAHHPPRTAVGVRVVPADQVKGTCSCDDDDLVADDEVPHRKPTEYVKLSDWQPPPSVEELEAALPPRGPEPQTLTKFPSLSLHREIANTNGWRSRPGNVHAR